jgi:hypothetical protein
MIFSRWLLQCTMMNEYENESMNVSLSRDMYVSLLASTLRV